jgi:glycosyltransferase involved in cell wall biosynthesis
VVATRVGGLAEQLGDEAGAILCDPTPADLAAALDRLLASPRDGAPVVRNPEAAWRDMAESLLRQAACLPRPA